jgi:hypothetical protein
MHVSIGRMSVVWSTRDLHFCFVDGVDQLHALQTGVPVRPDQDLVGASVDNDLYCVYGTRHM